MDGNRDEILRDATDPERYNASIVNWSEAGKGIEDPMRYYIWEYVGKYVGGWKGQKLLDVGTGTGWFPHHALAAGVGSVVGLDPSEKNIGLANTLYPDVPMVMDTLEEYAPDGEFDVVTALFSLTHILDLKMAMKKISGLLVPNGQLLLVEPDYEYNLLRPFDGPNDPKPDLARIDEQQYVIRIRKNDPPVVYEDIVRQLDVYHEACEAVGLQMDEVKKMTPTEQLIKNRPKYAPGGSHAPAVLIRYSKIR